MSPEHQPARSFPADLSLDRYDFELPADTPAHSLTLIVRSASQQPMLITDLRIEPVSAPE